MYKTFPLSLLSLLRCPLDQAVLDLKDSVEIGQGVRSGQLRCTTCDAVYAIEDGIVRMLSKASLDDESKHELVIREQRAEIFDPRDESSAWNRMEIEPTIEALEPLAGKNVLELGCGNGRLTVLLAKRAAGIVAVDFSLESLRTLATRIEPEWRIGLVNADCAEMAVQKNSFDRALSTLVSNLPTARHRAAMLRLAANATGGTGKFVFSTHHYGIRERLRGEPKSGHYRDTDIYRYLFSRRDILEETTHYFQHAQCHPVRIQLPLLGRLGFPVVAFSLFAEKIPLLNQLGDILLVVAQNT